jgi:ribosome-binding protein aMBF1 (putative translation factor)
MVALTRTRQRWGTREYADIASVRYEHGRLLVAFADGSEVSLAVDDLDAYGVEDREWQMARSEIYHITTPTSRGDIEIPWDVIRALTDHEFRSFLTEHAEQTAKRVGTRLRDLRNERRIGASDLARRVGVSRERIDRLEAGELPADLDFEKRVLEALGYAREDAFPVALPTLA